MKIDDPRHAVERFLTTNPQDVGCAAALAALDVYVELVAAGVDPDARYPGITAHLRACPPCGEDYEGLLLTVRETDAP